MSTRSVGAAGEAMATAFLAAKGWPILDQNLYLRFSEIDILARDGDTLVVVEVKAKKSASHGTAAEQVTTAKKARLRRLAALVEQTYNCPVRVDVIAIDDFGGKPKLTHYQNALA